MTAPKQSQPKPARDRGFACVVRGCKLDLKAHGRMAVHLEETEGPRSAIEFESRHRNRYDDDD